MQKAFLTHQGTLYFSSVPFDFSPIESAVTQLIQGIWTETPSSALHLLRERIFTNYAPLPICEGMIKVAAKRATQLDDLEFMRMMNEHTGPKISIQSPTPFKHESEETQKRLLNLSEIRAELLRLLKRGTSPKPVSAILLGKEGEVLAFGWNESQTNKTAHAELNLIHAYYHRHLKKIPRESCLYVSLRPCAMCAAQIVALAEDLGSLKITFLEDDPGPSSKNSCLFEGSDLWKKIGSPKLQVVQASLSI